MSRALATGGPGKSEISPFSGLSVALLTLVGCGIGESGISPPADQLFFPAGLAADPGADFIYAVNSNADLRYNAGTVVALSLRRAAEDRGAGRAASWPLCASTRFPETRTEPARSCCRDRLDARVLNCDERGYVEAGSTVAIGSFGGAVVVQPFMRGAEQARRLFVAVRGEPSITFIDATVRDGGVSLRCAGAREGGEPAAGGAPLCEETFKLRAGGPSDEPQALPEEPYGLALDPGLGLLYVAHLASVAGGGARPSFGGVSAIDVCAPERTDGPRLAWVTKAVFPGRATHSVTSLSLGRPGDPGAPIFATARFTSDIAELYPRGGPRAACDPQAPQRRDERDLQLVPGRVTQSSVFVSPASPLRGANVRAFVLSADGRRAYVLHRNSEAADRFSFTRGFDPAAVVVIDRQPDERGEPVNRPTDVIDVCMGPTDMQLHDAGRGPRLFITCFEGGQIYVVDPVLPAVVAIVEIGRGPSSLVFAPGDRSIAYVAGFAENNVSVVDFRPGSPTENAVIQRIGFPRPTTVR